MPARRCRTCAINYPANPYDTFKFCQANPEHETEWSTGSEPDEDWEAKVERIARELELAAQAAEAIPIASRELSIVEEDGRHFVDAHALYQAGVRYNSRGPSFRLFVANGRIWETQGWDESRRRWWIEEVTSVD